MKRFFVLGIVATVAALTVVNAASALVITPNDDTYINESTGYKDTVHDSPIPAGSNNTITGIYLKGASGTRRAGFMEYTIPNHAVTSATFNLTYFRSQSAGTAGNWTFRLLGSNAPASFDENTLTWNTAVAAGGINSSAYVYNQLGSDVALQGGNSGDGKDVTPNVPVSIDITAYFNAHQGETVTFKLSCVTTSSGGGGSFQDRELSRSMGSGAVPAGPFIEYIPEPATALLLVLGSLGLLRRR